MSSEILRANIAAYQDALLSLSQKILDPATEPSNFELFNHQIDMLTIAIKATYALLNSRLFAVKFKKGERLLDFIERFESVAEQHEIKLDVSDHVLEIVNEYIFSVLPIDIKDLVKGQQYQTTQELLVILKKFYSVTFAEESTLNCPLCQEKCRTVICSDDSCAFSLKTSSLSSQTTTVKMDSFGTQTRDVLNAKGPTSTSIRVQGISILTQTYPIKVISIPTQTEKNVKIVATQTNASSARDFSGQTSFLTAQNNTSEELEKSEVACQTDKEETTQLSIDDIKMIVKMEMKEMNASNAEAVEVESILSDGDSKCESVHAKEENSGKSFPFLTGFHEAIVDDYSGRRELLPIKSTPGSIDDFPLQDELDSQCDEVDMDLDSAAESPAKSAPPLVTSAIKIEVLLPDTDAKRKAVEVTELVSSKRPKTADSPNLATDTNMRSIGVEEAIDIVVENDAFNPSEKAIIERFYKTARSAALIKYANDQKCYDCDVSWTVNHSCSGREVDISHGNCPDCKLLVNEHFCIVAHTRFDSEKTKLVKAAANLKCGDCLEKFIGGHMCKLRQIATQNQRCPDCKSADAKHDCEVANRRNAVYWQKIEATLCDAAKKGICGDCKAVFTKFHTCKSRIEDGKKGLCVDCKQLQTSKHDCAVLKVRVIQDTPKNVSNEFRAEAGFKHSSSQMRNIRDARIRTESGSSSSSSQRRDDQTQFSLDYKSKLDSLLQAVDDGVCWDCRETLSSNPTRHFCPNRKRDRDSGICADCKLIWEGKSHTCAVLFERYRRRDRLLADSRDDRGDPRYRRDEKAQFNGDRAYENDSSPRLELDRRFCKYCADEGLKVVHNQKHWFECKYRHRY